MNKSDSKTLLQNLLTPLLRQWKIFTIITVLCTVYLGWQLAGQDPLLRFQQGMAAAKNGDGETVFREAGRLLKTSGFESYGHILRGTWYLETRRYEAAAGEFRLATENPETRVEAYTRCGEALYRMQKFVDAEQMLLRALEHDADNSDAHRWLASTYYDLGAMSPALVHLKIVAEMNPDDGRPLRLSGLIERDFHRDSDAIEHYREALRRNLPDSEREAATLELAECQVRQLQYSEALETLRDANPSAQGLALQAACFAALGDFRQAISRADDALKLNPKLVYAILTRASIEMEVGKAENIIDLLERAATAHPGNFEILFQLVQALRRAGRVSEADAKSVQLAELEKLVDEFAALNARAFSDLDNAELRLRLGQLAQQLDRSDLARTWLQAALAIDPGLAKAADLLKEVDKEQ